MSNPAASPTSAPWSASPAVADALDTAALDVGAHAWPGTTDPALQAYILKHVTRVDREALTKNLRGMLGLLTSFEVECALEVLRDFSVQSAPGLTRLLLHVVWEDTRPELQAGVLSLLGDQPDRGEVLAELLRLRKHLQDAKPISALVTVLSRAGRDLPFKVFKPYLAHPDDRVRANTVEALLDRLHPRLAEVFALLVNDPSARVRALAALALWRLGRPLLANLLEETEHPGSRAALAYSAGRAGQDPRLAAALFSIVGSERQPLSLRLVAARSLASAASKVDLARMLGLAYRASDRELRRALVASASVLDPQEATDYLVRVLAKLQNTTRCKQIAGTLSLLGMAPVLPPATEVLPYLEHPDGRVAACAVEMAARYADAASVTGALTRSLAHAHGRVASNAAVALWRRGFVPALGRLREMASLPAAPMRASALWGLGRIGGLLAQDIARPLLEDSDEGVRRWAFEALRG